MVPLSRFSYRPITPKLLRLPSSCGMDPDNRLLPRSRYSRLPNLPNSGGIGPLRSLPHNRSSTKFFRLPNSAGIESVMRLALRSRCVNLLRPPRPAGILPDRPAKLLICSFSTRCGVPPTVIPSQSEMGVPADQFRKPRVSLAARRISQSATKPGLLAASRTAPSVEQSSGVGVIVGVGAMAGVCAGVVVGVVVNASITIVYAPRLPLPLSTSIKYSEEASAFQR